MRISIPFRVVVVPAFVASMLVGCSGGGTTQDNGASTAPPLTKESLKEATANVNAGAGGMVTPGVKAPKH